MGGGLFVGNDGGSDWGEKKIPGLGLGRWLEVDWMLA